MAVTYFLMRIARLELIVVVACSELAAIVDAVIVKIWW